MFDSYTDDQASTLFNDEMYEEGRNADEDKLADEVYNYYNHLIDDRGMTREAALDLINHNLKISNAERYIP